MKCKSVIYKTMDFDVVKVGEIRKPQTYQHTYVNSSCKECYLWDVKM
jgi:hypothetical protein